MNREDATEQDLPVACSLTPAAIAARGRDLLPGLVRRAESREAVVDGLRFTFPSDALPAMVATIDAERQCCRFLRFDITVEPDLGPIRLTLSGPPGTGEFLAALLDTSD